MAASAAWTSRNSVSQSIVIHCVQQAINVQVSAHLQKLVTARRVHQRCETIWYHSIRVVDVWKTKTCFDNLDSYWLQVLCRRHGVPLTGPQPAKGCSTQERVR
jgi:hypothetical protein